MLDVRVSDFGNACYVPEARSPDSPYSDATLSPGSVHIEPGLPSYSNSQSLEDGIGRGTLAYTAPELVRNQPYSFSVDIYSLGVTFYSLLCGFDPFAHAKTNIQIIMGVKRGFFDSGMQPEWNGRFLNGESVEPKVIDLIQTMVQPDPSFRPTARQVLEVLDKIDF
jgi:serine/threonine protein kinase